MLIITEKLRQVVLSKHGNPKTTTDKVCKFFVDAVENGKYGWFWTCPWFAKDTFELLRGKWWREFPIV